MSLPSVPAIGQKFIDTRYPSDGTIRVYNLELTNDGMQKIDFCFDEKDIEFYYRLGYWFFEELIECRILKPI